MLLQALALGLFLLYSIQFLCLDILNWTEIPMAKGRPTELKSGLFFALPPSHHSTELKTETETEPKVKEWVKQCAEWVSRHRRIRQTVSPDSQSVGLLACCFFTLEWGFLFLSICVDLANPWQRLRRTHCSNFCPPPWLSEHIRSDCSP